MDCSPPGSSVHGIFQARVLEWGAIAFSLAQQLRRPCKAQNQPTVCSDLKNLSREGCIEIGSLPDLLEMVQCSNIINLVSLITCLVTMNWRGGGDDRKENETSWSASEPADLGSRLSCTLL